MAGQGALAQIAATLNPGAWTKDTSPEENLRTFNRYIVEYGRWYGICAAQLNLTGSQRWDLFLATGGKDLEDLVVHEAGVEIRQRARVDAVVHVPAQGGQPEVVAVPAVDAIVPTEWEAGLDMIRAAINKHSNQIMARSKLMRL